MPTICIILLARGVFVDVLDTAAKLILFSQ